jgi:hypothetical protein
MVDGAFMLELVAGLFYCLASLLLLRLAARTRQLPERLLGFSFLAYGVSYVFFQLPFFPMFEDYWVSFSILGRVFTALGVVTSGQFTRTVFRPTETWARRFVFTSVLLVLFGILISGAEGDWEGLRFLSGVGVWMEWAGTTAVAAWIAVEGFLKYRDMSKRVTFGLASPVIANRFFLWGVFGLMQLLAMMVLIPMYIGYEQTGAFSTWADASLGVLEMLAIFSVWLAFFPPAFYAGWIERRSTSQGLEAA